MFKGIKMTPLEASNIYLNKTEKSFSELLLLSADIFVENLNKYISKCDHSLKVINKHSEEKFEPVKKQDCRTR